MQVDKAVATDAIQNHGADLVMLFPVYEEKFKDGQLVSKVRLVADGRTHYNATNTYASTPSREELLILLHVIASLEWEYAHIDEIRAFLNAPYSGEKRAFTKFRGADKWYEIVGALYGLKSSPKDYQDVVEERFTIMGFKRLHMCSCIYIYRRNHDIVIVYDYVDDFIFTGNNRVLVEEMINQLRGVASTTQPIWNANAVLGMEIERIVEKKIIKITMKKKIIDTLAKFHVNTNKIRQVPMSTTSFIIKEQEFEQLSNDKSKYLNKSDIEKYMAIVGSLIWISGIRLDILFCVMYLSWATKSPRQHHMNTAYYCMEYLSSTVDIPLVLGGSDSIGIHTYTDASLGTAPKGRSVIANLTKLSPKAGAINAKTSATTNVYLASFESELDGATSGVKTINRVNNRLTEMQLAFAEISKLFSDNEAMIKFIQGEGLAKGVRHIELRMWYCRDEIKKGNISVNFMPGVDIPADRLTKAGDANGHRAFVYDIMGLALLND